PKMRVGKFNQETVLLERGQDFILFNQEIIGDQHRASVNFEGLPAVVKPGDWIFMNDGYIQLQVDEVVGDQVHCKVKAGGELRAHKGVNFPGIDLGISAFTDQDRELLKFAAEQKLDGFGESFVQGAADIQELRSGAAALDYDPMIIAKIERAGALENIDQILEVSDCIMVARGDLGVEIPIEKIPNEQKELIHKANLVGKPVITATQMLESMTHNRRPTRSEATDVANAILDGTDCVMLSGETAVGKYPVETVTTMSNLACEAESKVKVLGIADLLKLRQARDEISQSDLIALAVYLTIETIRPALVIILANTGDTVRRVSRFGLEQWIVAPSQNEITCQRLEFSRGVLPAHTVDKSLLSTPESRRKYAIEQLETYGVDCGLVLLVEGSGTLKAEDTKRIDIID
ncbi:MAG: pyruvate kinase, partial [Anaerolineales bacterium]|nr:pyruvate kinase [Anaerolineales bacterium]